MNSMDLKYLKSNLLLTLDVLVLLNSSGVLVGIFGRKLYDHEKMTNRFALQSVRSSA